MKERNRTETRDRLELPQPGIFRVLHIHTELVDLVVDGQHRLKIRRWHKPWLTARSREHIQANVDITNVMAVAQGEIHVPFFVG